MFLAAVLALNVQASPAPSPTPPLKTIITITVRPLCAALHKMVIPFVITEKQNNQLFMTMEKELGRYRSWNGNVLSDTGQQGTYTANGELNLQASNLDQQATLIYQRAADIEKQLAQSYHDIPVGRDPALDEIRARMDNIARLQYALAAKYDLVAGRTLNAMGLPPALSSASKSAVQGEPDYVNNDALDYATPAPAGVATPGTSATPVTKAQMFSTRPADVANALDEQERSFVKPALNAVQTCDGP